jgi:hypothetical protein
VVSAMQALEHFHDDLPSMSYRFNEKRYLPRAS